MYYIGASFLFREKNVYTHYLGIQRSTYRIACMVYIYMRMTDHAHERTHTHAMSLSHDVRNAFFLSCGFFSPHLFTYMPPLCSNGPVFSSCATNFDFLSRLRSSCILSFPPGDCLAIFSNILPPSISARLHI